MSYSLLPCPFCGGEAVIGIGKSTDLPQIIAIANCTYCKANAKPCNSTDDAATAWNTREPVYPEPDWADSPDWAQWWAIDKTGVAYWYNLQPSPGARDWYVGEGREHASLTKLAPYTAFPHCCDWRLTLRRRPEVTV